MGHGRSVTGRTGDGAERYQARRSRQLAERRARQEEWDFQASRLTDADVVDQVGRGWRPLVRGLHRDLLRIDHHYRLYSIEEQLGGLRVVAKFARRAQAQADRRVQAARAQAFATCEACGHGGWLRPRRPQMKTLCDECSAADRAAAENQGEPYADAALAYFMSGDRNYPPPEETLAWLRRRAAG
jgi:hypothetical protein